VSIHDGDGNDKEYKGFFCVFCFFFVVVFSIVCLFFFFFFFFCFFFFVRELMRCLQAVERDAGGSREKKSKRQTPIRR